MGEDRIRQIRERKKQREKKREKARERREEGVKMRTIRLDISNCIKN